MRTHAIFLFLFLFVAGCGARSTPKQIALTLDDAPIAKPLSYSEAWEREQAIDSLAGAIVSRGVPATVFAITSELATPQLRGLIARWTAAGVDVANHSITHRSFNDLPAGEGIREMAQAQATLSREVAPERVRRYFRFPYLEEGRTTAARSVWLNALDSLALAPARVSITTDDWRFDNDYQAAEADQDWDRRYEVGQAYFEHVKESVHHWDALGSELYGRNVRHVLMLHANRINRDYMGQILDWLEQEGFEFISLDEAYGDDLYGDEVEWLGASGVSVLEQVKQTRMGRGTY